MALIPYLYAAYKNYETTGTPPFRALVLDYPDDKNAAALDDQMLVGDALLAYAFLNPRRDGVPRKVWLPAGSAWFDYNTGERHEDGRFVTVRFTPEKIPAFVKEGTLLPLAAPVGHIDAGTVFDLTVRIYGDRPVECILIEDDGETLDYKTGAQTCLILKWTPETGGTLTREGGYPDRRHRVAEWARAD
jgi:alpha-D-xyloside xylohydrolase